MPESFSTPEIDDALHIGKHDRRRVTPALPPLNVTASFGVEHGEPATVAIRMTTDAAQLLDVRVNAVPVIVPVASVTMKR